MDMTKAALMSSANKYCKGDQNENVMHPEDFEVVVGDYEEEISNGNWKGNEDGHKSTSKSNINKHEYVEEEGKYYQKYYHYFKGVRQCTRVLISKDKYDSETKPKNDLSIMPPPPSPAWKRIATPKRETNFLKSPHSSSNYPDLFPDENLTECQAVPNHLFSPMRQAELAGGRIPKYQEIPLDYPQPRSVDSTNLDSWLNSPGGPATPGGGRATPGLPATFGGGRLTPGLPATFGGGRLTPGLPATFGGGRLTPGLPATFGGGRLTPGLPATFGGGCPTTLLGRTTPGLTAFLGGRSTPEFLAPPRLPSNTDTQASPVLSSVPAPGAPDTPSVARRPATSAGLAVFKIGQDVGQISTISKAVDDRLEMLAKNAEKDKNLKSEVFRQMNNILNEETINSAKLNSSKKIIPKPPSTNFKEAKVSKSSPNKSDEIVSRGSWRFSSEHSLEPFVPVVKVKNDALTRPMVLKRNYDYYEPAVKVIIKKEGSKKHKLKDENTKTFKKQKVEEASESQLPLSKKVNFVCKDCGKRCSSLRDVKAHLCLPKVQCEDCKPEVKNFQNRRLLLLHLSHSHPSVGQRFTCQFCEKGASNKTYLKDHVKKFHPSEFIEIYGGVNTIVEQSSDEVIGTSLDAAENHSNEDEAENERDIETEEGPPEVNQHMDEILPAHEGGESLETDAVPSGYVSECTESFEEDIDAPDSVVNPTQDPDEVVETAPLNYAFHCERCQKGFHTSMRYMNHKKNCAGQKKVTIVEAAVTKTANPQHGKLAVHGRRSGKSQARRRNARFEQLKTNWSELMEGRERCGKCGRNNYAQDDLEKHKSVCRGTLLDSSSKYICPHCTHPSRVFPTENAMRRHVSTNHAKEAMEDEWDYLHDEKDCKGMAMARKHLFQ